MRRIGILTIKKSKIELLKEILEDREFKDNLEDKSFEDVLDMNEKKVHITVVDSSYEFGPKMAKFYTVHGYAITLPIDFFKNIEKTPNTIHAGLHKEYCGNVAQLYRNDYSKTPSKMNEFARLIKEDFPTIKDTDIEIVIFGGIRKARIMGLRFTIPKNEEIPGDYFEWNDFDKMD